MRSGFLKGIDKHYEKLQSPKIILSFASLIISIDDLIHAEKAFDRILKEIRNEKLDTSISKT